MNSLLNIIIAAGKDVDSNWMEIVIPVVIVIVYAIGGIVKMRSNQKKDEPSEEPESQSLQPTTPRYKPLDDSNHNWKHPNSRHAAPIQPMPAKQDKHIERQLTQKPAARQPAAPKQRPTLEAFLETQAPESLTERAAQAQEKAKRKEKARRSLALRAAQKRKVAKKPKPIFPQTAPATRKSASKATKQPETTEHTTPLAQLLRDHESIRTAIILKEILGKPIALRDF
jgi:type IV secretory pathway VirB10-like protein